LYRHRDTRTQAVQWLRHHVSRGATVAFELDLAWYLPDLDGLPFRVEWADRATPLAWYAANHIDLAVVGDRSAVRAAPAAALFPRPPYLPTFAAESQFVPNSYPIIDPAVFIVRTGAR
jgi:hypothetical protein